MFHRMGRGDLMSLERPSSGAAPHRGPLDRPAGAVDGLDTAPTSSPSATSSVG